MCSSCLHSKRPRPCAVSKGTLIKIKITQPVCAFVCVNVYLHVNMHVHKGVELGLAQNIIFLSQHKAPDWLDMDTTHHQGWNSTEYNISKRTPSGGC